MSHLLAIAAGGAIGSVMRFGVSTGMHSWLGRSFPYGTLTVNVIGSFLIGLIFIVVTNHHELNPHWRSLLMVGFLGAFTTFSTFSLETLELIEKAELMKALMNMLVNLAVCITATWIGISIAKSWYSF